VNHLVFETRSFPHKQAYQEIPQTNKKASPEVQKSETEPTSKSKQASKHHTKPGLAQTPFGLGFFTFQSIEAKAKEKQGRKERSVARTVALKIARENEPLSLATLSSLSPTIAGRSRSASGLV
jgi:hypothetical protein